MPEETLLKVALSAIVTQALVLLIVLKSWVKWVRTISRRLTECEEDRSEIKKLNEGLKKTNAQLERANGELRRTNSELYTQIAELAGRIRGDSPDGMDSHIPRSIDDPPHHRGGD